MTRAEFVTRLFTGVIALSTLIYMATTIVICLAARRASLMASDASDAAKLTLIMNFYLRFHEFAEKAKVHKTREAEALEEIDKLFLKKGIAEFIRTLTPEMEKVIAPVVRELDLNLKHRKIDMATVEFLKP